MKHDISDGRSRDSVDEWLDSLDPKTTPARDGKNLRAIGRALDHVEESHSELVRATGKLISQEDRWQQPSCKRGPTG